MKKLLLLTVTALLAGCAPLQPGADPVVVRAEQLETGALSTFQTFLRIDNENRSFWKTNAPATHNFAEYLREPVVINGTNLPRDLAFVLSLDNVKQAYKQGKASSNDVNTVVVTLQAALNQAGLYISTTSTNHP